MQLRDFRTYTELTSMQTHAKAYTSLLVVRPGLISLNFFGCNSSGACHHTDP